MRARVRWMKTICTANVMKMNTSTIASTHEFWLVISLTSVFTVSITPWLLAPMSVTVNGGWQVAVLIIIGLLWI